MLNFTFPDGNAYYGIQYQTLFSLNCIELFGHIFLDGPFSALNFWLIFRTSILHPNLKFILLCQSACIFARAIARTILNLARILMTNNVATTGPFTLMALYMQPTYIRNFIVHVLVIERILATLYFESYEAWRSWWFSASWFALISLIASMNAAGSYFFPIDLVLYISMWTFIGTLIFAIFEILAFFYLKWSNEAKYAKKIYKLTVKYQLSENIRTTRQLFPCIYLHFINIFLGTLQGILSYYHLIGNDRFTYDLVNGQLVYTTSTIISFFIELTMITYHPFLKRECLKMFRHFFRCTRKYGSYLSPHKQSNTVAPAINCSADGNANLISMQLLNIRGEPLLMEKEADEYFRQLSSAWA